MAWALVGLLACMLTGTAIIAYAFNTLPTQTVTVTPNLTSTTATYVVGTGRTGNGETMTRSYLTFPAGTNITGVTAANVSGDWTGGGTGNTVAVVGQQLQITWGTGCPARTSFNITVGNVVNPSTGSTSYSIAGILYSTTVPGGAAFTSATYTIVAPTLTVTQGADAGRPTAKIYRTQGAVQAVDELVLTATNAAVTVGSIVVRGLDTVGTLTTDVTGVRLFVDDGDGSYDAGDTQIGTQQAFSGAASGSTVTFSGLARTVAVGTPQRVWVVYTLGAGAIDGHVAGSRVQTGDITSTTTGAVVTVSPSPIDSAAAGQTIQVDNTAPVADTTDPLDGAVLTGASKTIAGSASDNGTLASVDVRIARSDGAFWTGSGWGAETWLPATGTASWTYAWTPLPAGENRTFTYTVTARATDSAGLTGSDATPPAVSVDTLGPSIVSASAVDATHVDVTFNEPLAGGTIAGTDFTIAGLTVSGAALQPDAVTVRLTTSAQTPGANYTVVCAAGNLTDAYGVSNAATQADFTGFLAAPSLTVSQGSDPGRPAGRVYAPRSGERAVDELVLTASVADVTVDSIAVRGLDTADTLLTDVSAVGLFLDDADGVYDAGDTRIGTSQVFSGDVSGSSATFSSLGHLVSVGTPQRVWIVYTTGSGATDGHLLGSRVQTGDVAVAAPATVSLDVSPIDSAASGQTIQVDAAAPTVDTSDPLDGAVLTGASKTISGTAGDGGGSGIASVEVRIGRSDGGYWNGSDWTGTSASWNAASGTTNWTYDWTPLPVAEDRTFTYTIDTRATDSVGTTGTDATPPTVRVDTLGPSITSATAVDATHVDVVFSEPLAGATISGTDFTIAGLTVSDAALQGDTVTVRLTTSSHGSGTGYTVVCSAGNVTDAYGVANPATQADFTGFVTAGTLTVAQGSDTGRPSALEYVTRTQVRAVDEFVLTASGGDVTVDTIVVRGIDTADALTADVSSVRLFVDNGDGDYGAGDTEIGGAQTFSSDVSGSTATFSGLAHAVTPGTPQSIWIVYTMGAAAGDGHVLGSRVQDGDVTATSGTVDTFVAIDSAEFGETLAVDASAPSVDTTDPAGGAVLTSSPHTIAGTAADAGSGVAAVALTILRSDGLYFNGTTFAPGETWLTASGTTSWSYDWTLAAGQNGAYAYTITARATDGVGEITVDATPVTNVRIDNVGPAVTTVTAVDETTIDVLFTEEVDPLTVDASDFTVLGLSVTSAVLQPDGVTVRLTTSAQVPDSFYTVAVALGDIEDLYGNVNGDISEGFYGFGSTGDTEAPSVPVVTSVTPGAASPVIASLAWDASTDNVGVTGYRIWRATSLAGTYSSIATTSGVAFDDVSGIPGQQYYYKVSAYDAAGNESAPSSSAGPVAATWTQAPHATYGSARLCGSCHAPHQAATAQNIFRDTGAAAGELSVCYACHDGQGASTNVKNGASNSFALASGHEMEQAGSGGDLTDTCSSCHTPHLDYTSRAMLPAKTVNGVAISAADNTWCLACHNDSNSWYGAGYLSTSAPSRDSTGYPISGTYPGESVYTSPTANAHSSIEASAAAGRQEGDCLYCHSSHRGANGYDALTLTFRPTTPATLAGDQASGTYAESCFYCHGGVTPPELSSAPTNIKQFVTAGTPRAGHRIKTAGGKLPVGAPLPCYDCHNPHGSARGNASLLADTLGQDLTTGDAAGVRAVCFSCHATSDAMVWDSVSASYVAVDASEVEGLRRDGADGSALKLPDVNGHQQADARSCYTCHGSAYTAGANNVHNPSGGVSQGGESCYGCHVSYQTMEDGTAPKVGANRTDFYHHVLGGSYNGGAYADGDYAPGPSGAYPTTGVTDIFCVTCHVDHDEFNSNNGANLREQFPSYDGVGRDTDFDTSYMLSGLCTSCHGMVQTKDKLNQASDVTSSTTDTSADTQAIGSGPYAASAHTYKVESTFGDSTKFRADCSKCHSDEQRKDFQTSSARFGTHYSGARRLVSAFGGTLTDPLAEDHCYGCHIAAGGRPGAKTVAQRDVYGSAGATMSAESETVYEQFEGLTGSKHPVKATAGGSVECENCHNPHNVKKTSRVSDPDNTMNLQVYGTVPEKAAFCLRCHDGSAPAYTNVPGTYVPYAVTLSSPSDDKSANAARGHWSASGSIAAGETQACGTCHDNHGSNAPKLLGAYDPSSGDSLIGVTPVTANDNTVCGACHDGASTSFPGGETQRAASGYLTDGTWPGMTTYNVSYVAVSHTGNGHLNAIWPATTYAAGDCKNCHDVHGTANANDELRGVFDPASAADDKYATCFMCHDGTVGAGKASTNIKQYYPAAAGGTNGGPRAGHQVVTSVAGASLAQGDATPCYDCHNPHGSSSAYGLQVRDIGDAPGEISLADADGVRKFCFACHATADTAEGWAGAAWAAVGTTVVEGIRRDGSDGSVLALPSVNGHRKGDTLQSCYTCHGDDATNNVHNPSGGISTGGSDCYGCHGSYQGYMEDGLGAKTGVDRATTYHHVLGTAGNDGDKAFAAGTYPTGTATDVYCLSCHVDHDKFNASKSGNLRASQVADPAAAATDYGAAAPYGTCVSCHGAASLAKQLGGDQLSDGSTATPKIVGGAASGGFGLSAHNYTADSTFSSDSTAFSANCSKCHNDEQTKSFQGTPAFGTHFSSARRLLSALGGSLTDPLGESACYRCHSETGDAIGGTVKPTAGRDWYDAAAMTAVTGSEKVYKQFQLASKHAVVAVAGNSVECENCHNAHVVTTTARVTDPDNTYNGLAYGTVSEQATFCLRCHDASNNGLPAYTVNATTYVPASVTQGDAALDDKWTYRARGHWTANGSIGTPVSCAACHDNHGSAYPKMLGAYDPATGTNKVDGAAITGDNNTVCEACHTSADAVWPAGEAQREAGTGYLADGTWPGSAIYTGGNGIHKTAALPAPSTYAGGDCKNCHDVHGTANTYDEIRGTFAAADFGVCFNCHDADGPSTRDIKQYYPVGVGGTGAGTGHVIRTAGGNIPQDGVLPCYDCHNPHGSGSADGLQVRDIGDAAGEIDLSSADGVRKFCFVCHSTSDTTEGWTGSAWTAVGTTAVEGLARNAGVLKLPARSGHNKGDLQSCYQCHGGPTGVGTNNVHSPSGGVSNGGGECYTCHPYQSFMEDDTGTKTGAANATVYHHVLGGNVSSSYTDGDTAPGAGTYPNLTNATRTDVFCVSCHSDHNYFNGSRASNLRTSITAAGSSVTNTDYGVAAPYGICVSCHDTSMTKQGMGSEQLDDGSTATPKIVGGSGSGGFGLSVHNYAASSTFTSDSTAFNANCSKCHTDEQTKDSQGAGTAFGTHYSGVRRLLSALGATLSDPLAERECYRCHSETGDAAGVGGTAKSVAGRDWYDAANMTTVAGTEKVFKEFQLASKHPVVAAGGNSVECESCHNAHVVTSTARVTDPANTYDTIGYGTSAEKSVYCLKCHSGAASLPAYTVNGTTYVPYSVTIAAGDAAAMNKSSNAARSHWVANGSIGTAQPCANCHDKHGSAYPRILGAYDPATGTNKVNGAAITGNNNTVCEACHTAADAAWGTPVRDGTTGYLTDGTWPGSAVYTGANGIHKTAALPAPSTYAAGDCKNCHDVHGTANTYDEIRGTFSNSDFSVCLDCHDADGPSTRNIYQYYPTTAGGGATQAADTRYGHRTETAGTLPAGSALPCYDCHNPHGSGSADGLLVVTRTAPAAQLVLGDTTYPFNLGSAAGVRSFCFACHTTAGATDGNADATPYGWNGSGYAQVTAGALLEGIDRTVYDGTNKRGLKLPRVSGHYRDDTQSCQNCHGGMTASSTTNVHNPGPGGSNGGLDCLNCHGATSAERFDKMVNDTTVYHHVLDAASPGLAPNATNTYPTSTSALACVSCHTDHNYFNAAKGSNLRTSITDNTGANTNMDFIPGGSPSYGVCVSCHTAAITKNDTGARQKTTSASAQTPAIPGADYDAAKHDYDINNAALVGFNGSAFRANCSKCHDDEQDALKTYQNGTYKIGTHYSAEARLAKALGAALTSSATATEENLCYACHAGAGTNDGYGIAPGGTPMSAPSKNVQTQAAKTTSRHNVAGYSGLHKSDEYNAAPGTVDGTTANGWWGATNSNKHVECEDCHDVHKAKAPSYEFPTADTAGAGYRADDTAVAASGANYGVWGVTITGSSNGKWAGAGAAGSPTAPTYTKTAAVTYEWQLCLKCHSRYAWGQNTPPATPSGQSKSAVAGGAAHAAGNMTDVGNDFNPSQYAYHPLFKIGRNQPPTNANGGWANAGIARGSTYGLGNTMLDGWRTQSLVTCSDCHNNNTWTATDATGPHGSDQPWILRGLNTGAKVTQWNGTAITPNSGSPAGSGNMCLNCHRADVYGYGNGGNPATYDDTLSRHQHLDGGQVAQCGDGANLAWAPASTGCFLCHGGRGNDGTQAVGMAHGSSMGAGDGASSAADGNDVQDGTLMGDAMGKRFMNGAGWDAHQLGDTSGGSIGCSPIGTANQYSSCTNHNKNFGKTCAPDYYYPWQ